jgi:hypothetical protein
MLGLAFSSRLVSRFHSLPALAPPTIANPVIMPEDYRQRAMAFCDGQPLGLWKTLALGKRYLPFPRPLTSKRTNGR